MCHLFSSCELIAYETLTVCYFSNLCLLNWYNALPHPCLQLPITSHVTIPSFQDMELKTSPLSVGDKDSLNTRLTDDQNNSQPWNLGSRHCGVYSLKASCPVLCIHWIFLWQNWKGLIFYCMESFLIQWTFIRHLISFRNSSVMYKSSCKVVTKTKTKS